jgi:hypothetical protein
MGGIRFTTSYLVIILLIFNLLLFTTISDIENQAPDNSAEIFSRNLPEANDIASTRSTGELVDSISQLIEVGQGENYYIRIDPETDTLNPIPKADKVDALPKLAQDALDRVPSWLHNDLADKFFDLANVDIHWGSDVFQTFADLDSDGDFDLAIGDFSGRIFYFENQGTAHEPIFIYNYLPFNYYNENTVSEYNVGGSDPTFIDIDADNDLDIFIGNGNGNIVWGRNEGSPTSPDFTQNWEVLNIDNPNSIDFSPTFGDLDEDGDFDLTIGCDDGRLYYFENIGTETNASFTTRPLMYFGIDVGSNCKPSLADLDNDGDLDLTIGSDDGNDPALIYYRNIGSPLNPIWFYETTMYTGMDFTSGYPSPDLSDLDADGCLDLFIGNSDGYIQYFENIGTASEPQWMIWSSYQVVPGISYFEDNVYVKAIDYVYVNKYAGLIVNSENRLIDEIGFAIAHTSSDVLRRDDVYPEVFADNAKYLYLNDQYIDYADIVEYGDFESRDYYSTVKYYFNDTWKKDTRYLPRDIYYWYVVHPKITDEVPTYINPDTGEPAPPPTGKFWRDYLFNHNDSAYPADPYIDNNGDNITDFKYPRDENPPLLSEKLEGIKTLYNGIPYNAPRGYANDGHNNTRPWGYKDHAIEAVSNWVAKTLPLNQQEVTDEERPIQPVRIARHHNGNCGELQDLTSAAARTALIPATGILLLAEDHVWGEFYEDGWHQWDNYWSDGGSVVDNFDNYWVGWGQRGGSGITKWHGDDHTTEVTGRYIPEEDISHVTTRVLDRNGYPVDGARVMVGSHWLTGGMSEYQVSLPFPSIWNYTDANGECEFMLATQEGKADGNKNFSFKVISKVGNAEQGKTELEHGVDYIFQFDLEGTVPKSNLRANDQSSPDNITNPNYKMEIEFEVQQGTQFPPNPQVGNVHPHDITTALQIDTFICNSTNFIDFGCGYGFDCYELKRNNETNKYSFDVPYKDDWYFVLSNEDAIETMKSVLVKINLYEYPQYIPEVSIKNPPNGKQFVLGDEIQINGTASDYDGEIVNIELEITGEGYNIKFPLSGYLQDDMYYWTFVWNTTDLEHGLYKARVIAYDNNLNDGYDEVNIELIDPNVQDIYPPTVTIDTPEDGALFLIGESVEIKGTAKDNFGVVRLELRIGSEIIDLMPSYELNDWEFDWDTKKTKTGEHDITIFAYDAANNIGKYTIIVELEEPPVDQEVPSVEITSPEFDAEFDAGEIVTIRGEASDDMGIAKIELSLDSKLSWLDITNSYQWINVSSNGAEIEEGTWYFDWNTAGLDIGNYVIYARVFDGVDNSDSDVRAITLRDGQSPYISIDSPGSGTNYQSGQIVKLNGKVTDNIEIEKLKINIDSANIEDEISKNIVLEGDDWYYDWLTAESYPDGKYTITITATDVGGNQDTDMVTVDLTQPSEDKEDKLFLIPGFEIIILVLAIFMMLAFKRSRISRSK